MLRWLTSMMGRCCFTYPDTRCPAAIPHTVETCVTHTMVLPYVSQRDEMTATTILRHISGHLVACATVYNTSRQVKLSTGRQMGNRLICICTDPPFLHHSVTAWSQMHIGLLARVCYDCQHRERMLQDFQNVIACSTMQTGEILIQVSGNTDRCICMVMVRSGCCGL